jgi:hypothetical protein
MRIIENLKLEIPGTNTHYFNLNEFNQESTENILCMGYTFLEDGIPNGLLEGYKRKIYLNVTAPTEFYSSLPPEADSGFNEVYSICPYSNKWLNEVTDSKKYKTIFYPFNKKDIPDNCEKIYDVIYQGGLHGEKYVQMLEIIKNYNYRYLSLNYGINQLTQNYLHYATNPNLSNEDKLKVVSQTKISICFNTVEIRNDQKHYVKSRKDWWKNKAFSHIDTNNLIPQFKSRCNEAAFCKTLNLVMRDSWNIIENYYDKDEFVYFDTIEELPNKIDEILKNWDKYIPMVEKAYKKSLNYTTENLYKIIKNNENKYDL